MKLEDRRIGWGAMATLANKTIAKSIVWCRRRDEKPRRRHITLEGSSVKGARVYVHRGKVTSGGGVAVFIFIGISPSSLSLALSFKIESVDQRSGMLIM